MKTKNNLLLGIAFTIISSLSYAILTTIVKLLSKGVSVPVIVFIQSTTCLVLMTLLLSIKKKPAGPSVWQTTLLHIHFFRTLFSLGISYLLFLAVKYIPLVDGILLANTAPLMVPFIGLLFLQQKINHRLWIPVLIGFSGVTLVLQPTPAVFQPPSLLALLAGVCMASSMLLVRKASAKDSSLTGAFYYFLLSTFISLIASLPFWSHITSTTILLLIGEGVLFFIVQLFLTFALEYASAQVVSSLYYSNILFAALITIFFFKTPINFLVLLGMVLTILGGLLSIRAEVGTKTPCCPVG